MSGRLMKYFSIALAFLFLLAQSFFIVPIAAAASTNLALNKPISANNYTQNYVAVNANDGSTSTYWEGAPNSYPNVLTVDLGASQSINKIVIKLNPSSIWSIRTQTFSILTSNDNSTYNTKVASNVYTFDPTMGNAVTINFSNTYARYVRLNFTANSGATGGQVAEFEVYGENEGGTPDLIVTDITSSPASPLAGDAVTFSAVVKNQGDGATPAGTIIGVSFWIDGTQVSWSDTYTASLPPGASVTLTANSGSSGSAIWQAASGTHTVMAWVDDINRINESNENNNQYSENLTVSTSPMPDLVITDLTCNPASPTVGDVITFTATIKNQGTAAGIPGVVSFSIDGAQVFATSNNTVPLAIGATTTATGTWIADNSGDHLLSAIVDSTSITSESNETNNSRNMTININSKPGVDLIITGVSYIPSYVIAGNTVIFSAKIKNQGTITGTAGTVSFKIDGVEVAMSANNTTPITAGGTLDINANVSWVAVSGSHVLSATVDKNNIIAETDETNNSYSTVITVSSGNRGAVMPYTRYEAENGSIGGGAVLRSDPTFDYSQTAAEASNQECVALPSNGSYVQWTISNGGSGIDMRFTMPDTSDGMGMNGSLDCYVNGTKVSTINLSSYWSWQYFSSDQPADAPNGGQAAFRFDEVHWKLSAPLQAGDILKIIKTNNDNIEYGIDFVEVEPVPLPTAQPTNSLSVVSYGATPNDDTDDLVAFNACVSAAAASGKSVYIPAGTFNLGNMWCIGSVSNPISNITITGAGIWYTNIQFTSANQASGGISLRVTGSIDFSNMYLNSKLRSRYNQNAIYKCFMDDFGTNSRIHDIWEDHFECGFWVADYAHTPVTTTDGLLIENCRIRNNLADGVNFCQGTSNSSIYNCSLRNNGDDALAMWPDSTQGAPMETNNSFMNNTIENNWRAAGIAIFGGSGHKAQYNYIKDSFMGSGIRMNTTFPGYHFDNNTGVTISDTTIIGCGSSHDCYNGEVGAIELEANNTAIKNITFSNIDIINTQRDAIQIGFGGGFQNILFQNININGTGLDSTTSSRFSTPHLGEAIFVFTGNGSATFQNLIMNNIEAPEKYLVQNGFNLIIKQ